MPRMVALSDLRTAAYRLADMDGATTRFPSSEVDGYINKGIESLWDIIISSRAWPWIGKTAWEFSDITSAGTTPPTITLTGTSIDNSFSYVVDILSIAVTTAITWQYSLDGGTTYTAGASTFSQAAGATKALGNSGVNVVFPIGTYAADNTWSFTIEPMTTASGVRAYELPTDFYKLHKVFASSSAVSTAYYEVAELPSNEEGQYRYSSQSAGGPEYYQIKPGAVDQDYILFYPTPPTGTYVQINYFPYAPSLSSDSSEVDAFGGWTDDFVPSYAAWQMAMKDELFGLADRLAADMQRMEKAIVEAARTRARRAPRVQDVGRSGDKWRRAWWQRGI
jgi:hypothetical protein